MAVNGIDPSIHLVHLNPDVTEDTVMEMGGEAVKGQDDLWLRRHCLRLSYMIKLKKTPRFEQT